jgi:hypothetical protein
MRELRAGKLAMSFIFIFFTAGNGFCSGADSEGWTSLQDGLYINSKSISRSDDGKISLWVKIVPEEGSDLMYNARNHLMEDGMDYQALKYDYTGLLSEIDCSRKRHRELMNIMYDVNKNIVHSLETSPASWKDIPPESNLDLVLVAVCN